MKGALDKKALYEEKYTAKNIRVPPYFGKQFQFILDMADYHQANPAILDLGGGTGEYSSVLQNLGYDVTLFDFSEVAVAKAKAIGVVKTVCADFNTCDFGENKYNVVLTKGFSPLNTDNNSEFQQYLNKIASVLAPKGFLIYWAVTDLSGTWTTGGWYNLNKRELAQYFDQVIIFPAFRYGCRIPVFLNRLLSKTIIVSQKRLSRLMTVIGLKFKE